MSRSFYDQYEQFLVEPTAHRYKQIRRLLMQSPAWPIELEPLLTAAQLVDQGQLREAELRLEKLLPSWLLSPRWHFLGEKISVARGDADSGHADRFQMHACLKGIMRTGDGSASSPFLITYPTDPSDILWVLHLKGIHRQMVRSDRGLLEILTCDDGREVWFNCSAFADVDAPVMQVSSAAEMARPSASPSN